MPVAIDFRGRALVRVVVVGAGAWGTAFARCSPTAATTCFVAAPARTHRTTRRYDARRDARRAGAVAESSSFREARRGHVAPATRRSSSLDEGARPARRASGSRRSCAAGPVAVLSGPNMAEEVADGLPSATVIASRGRRARASGCRRRSTRRSSASTCNDDLIGVELCAAAKNVIALAAGGVDGLGLGDNAKAALITRGLVEMARLGEACGAEPETFSGLAGMGDLIVTCLHPTRPQPPRRRADRARRDARRGAGRDRPGRRGPDDRAGAARPLAPARRRAADHRGRLRGARRAAAARARRAS